MFIPFRLAILTLISWSVPSGSFFLSVLYIFHRYCSNNPNTQKEVKTMTAITKLACKICDLLLSS
ncbi:hypothetical protein OnM2_036035 [Erysiphe neolycopersici]|uniref:Uncharacterized protein n=1 Tax=Erysiphe neolycopersici TaxID=212602 RepID=A0A420HXA1_9PEZI|nr:hypothetical protein OnM2_036035 [Erysiphe neolycopersici]